MKITMYLFLFIIALFILTSGHCDIGMLGQNRSQLRIRNEEAKYREFVARLGKLNEIEISNQLVYPRGKMRLSLVSIVGGKPYEKWQLTGSELSHQLKLTYRSKSIAYSFKQFLMQIDNKRRVKSYSAEPFFPKRAGVDTWEMQRGSSSVAWSRVKFKRYKNQLYLSSIEIRLVGE